MALGAKHVFEPLNFFLCCPFSEYENHGKSSDQVFELTAIKKNPEENSSGLRT